MFGISGLEVFLILIFGFLIFGPEKLPEIAKTVGKALAKFKSAQEEMNKVIKSEVYDPNSDELFKNPLDALAKMGQTDKKSDEKQESFSERKARYDKERAAKKAAEAKKVEQGAAASSSSFPSKSGSSAQSPQPSAAKADASQASSRKAQPTAEELFGSKPKASKPAAKKARSAPSSGGSRAKTASVKATGKAATKASSFEGAPDTATKKANSTTKVSAKASARSVPTEETKKVIEAADVPESSETKEE